VAVVAIVPVEDEDIPAVDLVGAAGGEATSRLLVIVRRRSSRQAEICILTRRILGDS
jgi:hypothetical protein